MKAPESQHGPPPAVDEGDPPTAWGSLWPELAPAPGRFGNTARLVVLVLATVAISETFRLPETALSAFIVLLVSRGERASTVMTALVTGIAGILAVLLTVVVFMASLSQPALRLPLIALLTFVAMFLARVSPLGPVLFAAGFIIAYGLTLGDEVLGLSLQPGLVGNTTEFALPQLVFLPPEEALVHFLLWLALAIALPVALVIAANLLTGRDPALLLRDALGARMEAAARFCLNEAGAEPRLMMLAREGTAGLLKLHEMSGPARRRASDEMLINQVGRLCLVLLATTRLPPDALPGDELAAAGEACREAARAVQQGLTLPEGPALATGGGMSPAAWPLGAELSRTLQAIRISLGVPPGAGPEAAKAAPAPRRLLVGDAFSNPDHFRFAFKVTLAVMLCYALESLTDWPGIHTCVITCFFVSLGTLGETLHKATLRIVGCLIGGALGIGAILLVMPLMSDLGDLLLVLAVVTALAGWVGSGSERIAYAGWQIGLAFYLTVLQGSGPTLDMETARDRIIGILLGNLTVFVIFTTIWPVGVGGQVRASLAKAVEQLAALLELAVQPVGAEPETVAPEDDARQAFSAAIAQASGLLVNDVYETRLLPGQRPIDMATVRHVQALMVPVSVILGLRADAAWRDLPEPAREPVLMHHRAMADWLRGCATWVRSGSGGAELATTLPEPPGAAGLTAALAACAPDAVHPAIAGPAAEHLAARAAWYGLLHQDIRAILDRVAPRPHPLVASQGYDAPMVGQYG